MNEQLASCRLCGRVPKTPPTAHHLIPRTCHRNKWFQKRFTRVQMRETIPVCRDCHHAIHEMLPDEKRLGRELNTVEKLLAHEAFGRYIEWAKKQK
jgi:hypothetical protein